MWLFPHNFFYFSINTVTDEGTEHVFLTRDKKPVEYKYLVKVFLRIYSFRVVLIEKKKRVAVI